MEYINARVLSNEEISNGIYKMIIENEKDVLAGQFFMLKPRINAVLPRPISVSKVDKNTLTFVYALVGKGTNEFASLKENDTIELFGPLGNGFNIKNNLKKIALVCGGIGIAPMVEVAKKFKEINENIKIDVYAGFRNDTYLIDDLKEYVDNIYISTDTGNFGHRGFITDILNVDKYEEILCCGPEIMMEKVVNMCKEKNVSVYVSMEKHMACGIGACLVCSCKTKDGNKRTCKDGPVFSGEDVVF
jgi:dihydroorotate dehydrogenase electron transfer subunit